PARALPVALRRIAVGHAHEELGIERLAVERDRFIGATFEEQVGLDGHGEPRLGDGTAAPAWPAHRDDEPARPGSTNPARLPRGRVPPEESATGDTSRTSVRRRKHNSVAFMPPCCFM